MIERIKYLVNTLNNATKAYDEGNPIMTDTEWDDLYFELDDLEKTFNLVLPNSPTQSISYEIVNELNKVEHNHKMLSLEKTKSVDEVKSFIGNQFGLAMCKMDGLTCSLTYRDGELVAAETRGNGLVGEDIFHNARVLPSIPKKIPYYKELVIDGEIICTYHDFEDFSDEYKNPRNFAAGSIRLLDSGECADRKLTFVAWDVITSLFFKDEIEYRLDQKLSLLEEFGFTVVPSIEFLGLLCSNDTYEGHIEELKNKAAELGYPIDGIVFKFADCAYGRAQGETGHHFKNALAFKFADETYETTLVDIEWTMGRTGVLTPVAIFKSIDIDGSNVSRASLHNISIIDEIFGEVGPFIGQTVCVSKRNMIIPQIESAYDTDKGTVFYLDKTFISVPDVCPVCGGRTSVKMDNNSKMLVCENPACEGKLINKLENFCGKKGLDIKGVSKATLEKMITWGWINSFSDLFDLYPYRNEWIQQSGFGEKSVDKILSAIEYAANNCTLNQFIASLGIPLIGTTASKDLEKHFKTWDSFIEAVENNFKFFTLPNFGGEMHNSIVNYDYTEAKVLVKYCINFNSPEEEEIAADESLEGKTFVITGKLNQFKNRDELKARIEALGGKVVGSVSKNTECLINNDVESATSKNASAKKLGVPILSEENFISKYLKL